MTVETKIPTARILGRMSRGAKVAERVRCLLAVRRGTENPAQSEVTEWAGVFCVGKPDRATAPLRPIVASGDLGPPKTETAGGTM